MRRHSLRWRIAALVAVAVVAVAVAIGVLVHQATYARAVDRARDAALHQLNTAARTYASTGEPVADAHLDSPRVPKELVELARRGNQGTDFGDGPNGPGMWAARQVGGRVLSVQVGMGRDVSDLEALDGSMALAGLVAVAVAVPLGAVSADRLGHRLRHAAGTARRIADGELDARIEAATRPGDEIAEISGAVDSMAQALQQRLLTEQRFTGDVAHELRTPLMGLVTSAELLPPGRAADYVRDRVRVLSALVEDLLEISRLDAGVERADLVPCALGELVEECVRRTGLAAQVRVVADAVVETDPRRLDRVVANLVTNAHRHGQPPVTVTVERTVVVVQDRGAGFPESLLADGPQRFRTGARERGHGHGLGLTIALGQARVIDAALAFSNAPDGGAVATLRLPEHG
ncbi:HAMP domain-containing sensor histidine kinase [Streptomyces sp. CT34]|uniref:sensor histidine kinase n=1 Tax=Streptomyces sp. CT34 TaxID=1553907 RepID=UPI0005BAE5B2|nr:HAMP domain-containing sensor histidine kinase [Streptomyces sp. CT34]